MTSSVPQEGDGARFAVPHRVLVGTSGFAYTAWKPGFYPKDLPAKKFLGYYAQHFPTTEINATFYRFPRPAVTASWYADVPADFSFTLKMSQRVTHMKRLKNVDEEMGWFMNGALGLQEKLGPILVQLPPNMKQDVPLLEAFAAKFAARARLAFEFRHDSWFTDETFATLRRHDCAFAVVEKEDDDTAPVIREVTAGFVYMRLRKGEYSDAELLDWARWMKSQPADVYCYLKHEDQAPALAQKLMTALDAA